MRMHKIFLSFALLFFVLGAAVRPEDDKPKDSASLFYKANSYYEQGDFRKALSHYGEILMQGRESANLYYNMGNAYFKLGDLGKAVLFYERAKAIAPQDADLKSNLEYAQSLVEDSVVPVEKMWMLKFLDNLTGYFNLGELAMALSALYFIIASLAALGISRRGDSLKRLFAPIAALILLFLAAAASFSVRIYESESLRPAIVISKEADCRFEPFGEATVYFKTSAGSKVSLLSSKKEWSRIRRLDGKTAWIKNDAIEVI